MTRTTLLSAALFLSLTSGAWAGSIKPTLLLFVHPSGPDFKKLEKTIKKTGIPHGAGIVVYSTPFDDGDFEVESKLNWGWLDRQTNKECKKNGVMGRGKDARVVAASSGQIYVLYNCR